MVGAIVFLQTTQYTCNNTVHLVCALMICLSATVWGRITYEASPAVPWGSNKKPIIDMKVFANYSTSLQFYKSASPQVYKSAGLRNHWLAFWLVFRHDTNHAFSICSLYIRLANKWMHTSLQVNKSTSRLLEISECLRQRCLMDQSPQLRDV